MGRSSSSARTALRTSPRRTRWRPPPWPRPRLISCRPYPWRLLCLCILRFPFDGSRCDAIYRNASPTSRERPNVPAIARSPGRSPALKLPGEGNRAPARPLTLVEAMCFSPALRAVQLEVGPAPLARPVLRGIEKSLAHSLRAVVGADGEVLDPAARPEAHRVHVQVGGAEAEQIAAMLGNEDRGRRIGDRVGDCRASALRVPPRRHRSGRREQPLVHA